MARFSSSSHQHQRHLPRLLVVLCFLIPSLLVGAFLIPPTSPSVAPPRGVTSSSSSSSSSSSRSGHACRPPPVPVPMPLHPTTLRRRAAQQEEEQEEGESWLVKLGYKAGEEDKTRSLKERLKSAGVAGVFAYIASEVLFWFISLPAGIVFYHQTTGEWLDLSSPEGQAKVAGFSAGFLAFARVALPVRAAVALAITPPLSKNVIAPLIERGVLKEREE